MEVYRDQYERDRTLQRQVLAILETNAQQTQALDKKVAELSTTIQKHQREAIANRP